MRVVFFGTPAFAVPVFSYLIHRNVNIVGVVTQPSRAQGRSRELIDPPIKEAALILKKNIPIFQPEKISTDFYAEELKQLEADFFIVVAYGEILKSSILDIPKLACINIHASLLPKYRGAAPIQRCLIDGEKETGLTIMHMVLKMDAGDVLAQEKLSIDNEINYGKLSSILAERAGPLLFKVMEDLLQGRIKSIEQDHSQATYAPKITSTDRLIDWNESAEKIHNKIRGLSPEPAAWCLVEIGKERKKLQIFQSEIINYEENFERYLFKRTKDFLHINCGKGILSVLEVQLEGKKKMPIQEFLQGNIHINFFPDNKTKI